MTAMTPERWREIKAVLEQVLELEGDERKELLALTGSRNAALLREVEELLAQEGAATPLTGAVAAAVIETASAPGELGTRIGPYLLEAEVGRGGMGARLSRPPRRWSV